MATTDVEICNLALAHIRQRAIVTLNDRSPAAIECRRFYSLALDAALRSFNWPFAKAVGQTALVLKPGTATPETRPGWRFAYEMPPVCLALREIARCNKERDPIPYEIGRYFGGGAGTYRSVIYTNATAPEFIYTCRVTEVEDFTPDFVEAFAYTLAMHLAMPLTGKMSTVEAMRKLAAGAVDAAEVAAANEDTNDMGKDPVPDWLVARFSGGPWVGSHRRSAYEDHCPVLSYVPPGTTPPVVVPPLPIVLALGSGDGRVIVFGNNQTVGF